MAHMLLWTYNLGSTKLYDIGAFFYGFVVAGGGLLPQNHKKICWDKIHTFTKNKKT